MRKLKNYIASGIGLILFVTVIALFVQTGHGGNPAANPNPSGGIDLTTMEPFQQEVTVTLNAGQSGQNVPINVPSGKLFVIEQVSAYGSAPSDQRINFSLLTHIAPDLSSRSHRLLFDKITTSGTSYYTVSQMVKIYADTPSAYARVSRSPAIDSVTFYFTVSGYFVDK